MPLVAWIIALIPRLKGKPESLHGDVIFAHLADLATAINATDFDILSIRKCPTTLYVDMPINKLDESSKLLNSFDSGVIGNRSVKRKNLPPVVPESLEKRPAAARDGKPKRTFVFN